jgi:glycosyltransferase involved in cell wall biosynthesis
VRSAELIEAEVRRLAGGSAATPTISVVIAAYNAERWIAATLDSILAQTEPAHEVIVVDDGSQDGTADVLSGYAGAVHVLRQDNAGPAPAFNRAVAAATGEYVAFSGADDLWDEHKLERQAAALRAQPEIDVAFTHACFFGTENWEAGRPAAEGLLDGAAFTRAMYEIGDLIPAPTAVVRRDLFERLGGYDPDFTSEDYEFWMRALEAGARFYYDPALLVRCRRHGSNLSTDLLTVTRCCLEIHERYAHLMDDPAVVKRTLARDLFMIGRYLVDEGSPGEARHSFRDAVRQRPTPRALAWTGVLALPPAARARAVPLLVAAKRGLT